MLYSSNTPYSYTAQPTYIDAYGYAGGSSGYNRASANSSEGAISNAAGGVLGNIPIISSFYNIGNSAYKGLKSTDSGAGDFFGNIFGPHHQLLSNLDNSRDLSKRKKRLQFVEGADGKMTYAGNQGTLKNFNRDKRKEELTGLQTLFGGIIGSSLASTIEGKSDRQAEQDKIDYNKKLQDYYQQQTGMYIPAYQTKDATPYNSSITQGFATGAMGLFDAYGGKKNKDNNTTITENVDINTGGTPMDTTKMVYNPEAKVNQQGDNFNWNAGTYGFEDGGVAVVGGKGNDDIALVDTNNGKDTGVRVQKGEMLVISKENVDAIEDALENGDKESVYDIIRRQFKEEPKEMDDEKKLANGGTINVNPTSTNMFWGTSENIPTMNATDYLYGTTKDVETEYPLLAESVYVSDIPASNSKLYDKLKGIDFSSLDGNAYDAYRFGLGLSNSQKELPRWTLPTDYLEYGQRLKSEASRGLSPEELSLLNTTADENSRYAMSNVYNLAGGNAGLALANIQNVGGNRMQDAIKINALNAERERANLSNYGSFLNQMNTYDRQQYLDRLSQDEKTKMAAAKLTQYAYKNMQNRADYNEAYGKNSLYAQLENEYLKQKELESQQKENYKKYLLSLNS